MHGAGPRLMSLLQDFMVLKWHRLIRFGIYKRKPVWKKSIHIDTRFAADNILRKQHSSNRIVGKASGVEVDTDIQITQPGNWTNDRIGVHSKADQANPMVVPLGTPK